MEPFTSNSSVQARQFDSEWKLLPCDGCSQTYVKWVAGLCVAAGSSIYHRNYLYSKLPTNNSSREASNERAWRATLSWEAVPSWSGMKSLVFRIMDFLSQRSSKLKQDILSLLHYYICHYCQFCPRCTSIRSIRIRDSSSITRIRSPFTNVIGITSYLLQYK